MRVAVTELIRLPGPGPRVGILAGIIVCETGNCQRPRTSSQNYYSERETRQERHARATCSRRDRETIIPEFGVGLPGPSSRPETIIIFIW